MLSKRKVYLRFNGKCLSVKLGQTVLGYVMKFQWGCKMLSEYIPMLLSKKEKKWSEKVLREKVECNYKLSKVILVLSLVQNVQSRFVGDRSDKKSSTCKTLNCRC